MDSLHGQIIEQQSSETRVILEGLNYIMLEYYLKFNFKVTNNQLEYDVIVARLQLTREVEAHALNIISNSKLVIA